MPSKCKLPVSSTITSGFKIYHKLLMGFRFNCFRILGSKIWCQFQLKQQLLLMDTIDPKIELGERTALASKPIAPLVDKWNNIQGYSFRWQYCLFELQLKPQLANNRGTFMAEELSIPNKSKIIVGEFWERKKKNQSK